MLKMIDRGASITAQKAKDLRALDVIVDGRYLSNGWTMTSKVEIGGIHSAGQSAFLFFENDPVNVSKFSHGQGVSDAADAMKLAESIGAPDGIGICPAVDFGAKPEDFSAIDAYFEAFRTGLQGKYKLGGYGGYDVVVHLMEKGLVDFTVQTAAWSDGKVAKGIAIYQYKNGANLAGLNVDLDECYDASMCWHPDLTQPKVPEAKRVPSAPPVAHQDAKPVLLVENPYIHSNPVVEVQKVVNAWPIDGVYGPVTQRAVINFQKRERIHVDGVVGPQTWETIQRVKEHMPLLEVPAIGGDVGHLQKLLQYYGCDPGRADCIYGIHTRNAVRRYQEKKHLTVDGICGPQTWGSLLS